MNRVRYLLALAFFAAFLAGCGNESRDTGNSDKQNLGKQGNSPGATPPPPPPPPPLPGGGQPKTGP